MKSITVKITLDDEHYELLRDFYSEKELHAAIKDDVYAEIYELCRALIKSQKAMVELKIGA